ncbi:MAG: hypothetical protein HY074_12855 [Deltaproteobacteria bacterium]|nr:hypothetical protein [Deltaproteobacteria bacterium]
MTRRHGSVLLLILSMIFWIVRCSPSFKDLSSPNGRQAIIDQANDDLTAGDCGSAIDILTPLVHSQYSNNDVLMVYASAFACQGGLNFPNLIGNLKDLGSSDIWSVLVKTDYSSGSGDGHVAAFDTAASEIYQTATPAGSLAASQRTPDANTFMVFIELSQIASVIAPLGGAVSSSGHKTVSITGKGSIADMCHVEVAVAEIKDSLQFVSAGAAINNVVANINADCAGLPGGVCPTNENFTTCMGSAAIQVQGQLLIDGIDNSWTL